MLRYDPGSIDRFKAEISAIPVHLLPWDFQGLAQFLVHLAREAVQLLGTVQAQAVDAVAHYKAHRARVVIRPDRLAAMLARLGDELLGHDIERIAPGNFGELLAALRPRAT